MKFLLLALIAIGAYLLGGINASIVVSKLLYKKDIRDYGSKNAGLTNFYRVFGKKGAVIVILIDVLKALCSIYLAVFLMRNYNMERFVKIYAGFFVMLGHVFPAYYGFKGGKSVLCGGTMTLTLGLPIMLSTWGAFILATALTHYVSLGSILAGIAFSVCLAFLHPTWYEMVFAIMASSLLVFKHSGNISRLASGNESKFSFNRNSN